MGSALGRSLAISLPLLGLGIAAPFLAPALVPGAAAAGAGAAGAGAAGGAASAAPAAAATVPTAATASSITPAAVSGGIQAGAQGANQLAQMAFNQPGLPQIPSIRAPAMSAAPFFSGEGLPSPAGAGLSTFSPGPGPVPSQGAGVAGDMGTNVAMNLFGPQMANDPFAMYQQAA